eukprot:65031_1
MPHQTDPNKKMNARNDNLKLFSIHTSVHQMETMMFHIFLTISIIFYETTPTAAEQCVKGGEQQLILQLKDVNVGTFNPQISKTGLENENNPQANTYSIIGKLNPEDYKNTNGKFEFYLQYDGTQGSIDRSPTYKLRWQQSQWVTAPFNQDGKLNYAPGFEVINFDPPDKSSGDDKFYGLGKSSTPTHCYLDGTSTGSDWFNCVGAIAKWSTPGIASFNRGSSRSEALYACKQQPSGSTKHLMSGRPKAPAIMSKLPLTSFTSVPGNFYDHPDCRDPRISTGTAWCCKDCGGSKTNIQVNFDKIYLIKAVGTMGRKNTDQWVTSYNLEYSEDGNTFVADGINNPLRGNSDRNTEVLHKLGLGEKQIFAKALRFTPVTWRGWKSMRIEAYGYWEM